MEDKILVCEQCGNEFVWSKEEQKVYELRDLGRPKYCAICRGMMEAEKKQFGALGKNPKNKCQKSQKGQIEL
jgi:hypothetical protein